MTDARPASGVVLPSTDDPLVAGLVEGLGGPPGRFARMQDSRTWWTAMRVLIALTIITCTLGWAQKAQCRDTNNWAWNGGVYQYTRVCYSDIVALYGAEGISDHQVPYVDHPVEYPVLTGAVMGVVGEIAHEAPGASYHEAALFYDMTVLLLALGAVLTVIATGLTARRRIWDAALVALAPTIVMHLGTNWDMLAVTLGSLGILAWSRQKLGWAGVAIGLATAAKLYPAFFLIPLLALCLRSGHVRAWFRTAWVALATFVVVNAPFWLTSPKFALQAGSDGSYPIVAPSPWQALRHGGRSDFVHALTPWARDSSGHVTGSNGVWRFWANSRSRGEDWDSIWLIVKNARSGTDTWLGDKLEWIEHYDKGSTIPANLNLLLEIIFVLLIVGTFWLTWKAPRRPRLPQLLFLFLAGFMITNKVDSPQYTLWLLPLVALALPRWRIFLAWQLSEIVLTIARFQYFVALDKVPSTTCKNCKGGIGYEWFATTVLIRDAIIVAMMVMVVRQILDPSLDVVRADGADDPAGGVLDGAEDRRFGSAWAPPPLPEAELEPVGV